MKIKDVTHFLNDFAPLSYAEDFDNVGLLVGNENNNLTGVLVTLDTLEEVVEEAIENNCNLIVSFHPIIFSGLKKITGKSYVERVVEKAIKNDIAIYAIHTALDNSIVGVNKKLCDVLGLKNTKILIPKTETLKKLITYVPLNHYDGVKDALFKKGAGNIGNYDSCSFSTEGEGTFRANENATPFVGNKNEIHREKEIQLSVIFEKHLQHTIVNALIESHPYEEVAYDIISLDNINYQIGMGMIGELPNEKNTIDFLNDVKKITGTPCIRHSKLCKKTIKKVAVLGGSGSFAIANAKMAGADIYITSDIKYHEFYKAENDIIIADIGHYESEQFTKNLLVDTLKEKFHNFAIILSNINTNPIYYL